MSFLFGYEVYTLFMVYRLLAFYLVISFTYLEDILIVRVFVV